GGGGRGVVVWGWVGGAARPAHRVAGAQCLEGWGGVVGGGGGGGRGIRGPAGPRAGLRDERDVRRLVDRRVLGAVDETRQVTAVSVYPSGLLGREVRDVSDDCSYRPRRLKREVGARAVHPDPQVLLRLRARSAAPSFY